jgi:phosphatidylserine/phosphatidylglycerophosphate/cardiolipin synthase-like enzyme
MRARLLVLAGACGLTAFTGCTTTRPPGGGTVAPQTAELLARARTTSVFGPATDFVGSPFDDVALSGVFPVRPPNECEVAVLPSGEDSFAVRMETLRAATTSIRIQALVFKGDESGLRIAQVLKEKKRAGLDVRVVIDAFSNPWLQTQWMLFDLKQNGIEVEGYEALGLQWLNEVPIPTLMPHYDPARINKRFHEKMWVIDGETDHAIAVAGGLNIGNEYFRANPANPDENWRDQDVVIRGAVIDDLVTAFDRNFDYFVAIKKSRGIADTNRYWDATRAVMDKTGKVPVHYEKRPDVEHNVDLMEARRPDRNFQSATCRFLQNRPRFKETYIQQSYLKLIESAREEILIANAYFLPTPSIHAALKDAARHCVAVTLVANSPETNDLPEITMVGRGYYKDLLSVNDDPAVQACANPSAGIKIWEWVGKQAGDAVQTQGTMHSKFAVFDRQISLVGSYNLDPRSEKLNSESALVFEQSTLSAELTRLLLEHDLAFSEEVTREAAARFEDPDKAIYRFRKTIGHLFESDL